MTFLAYDRLRLLWGALDWQHGTDNPYGTAQTVSGGTSAAAGVGTGVRRVIFTIDRTGVHAGADPAEFHFDFLNLTGGVPDDTWTTGDFTTLEGYLDTFWGVVKSMNPTGFALTQYSWYRVGPGVTPPNPAERVLIKGTPVAGTGSTVTFPPQVAMSITFRTAVRRSWGRTYLPCQSSGVDSHGAWSSSTVDAIANALDALVTSAAGSDFFLVVTSKALSAALNVEKIEVDDVADVIRRRRWKSSTYKKIKP